MDKFKLLWEGEDTILASSCEVSLWEGEDTILASSCEVSLWEGEDTILASSDEGFLYRKAVYIFPDFTK